MHFAGLNGPRGGFGGARFAAFAATSGETGRRDDGDQTPMQLLALSGSLRKISSNTAVLKAAAVLASADMQISLYPGMGELPHFNPDLDTDEPPAIVRELRR